MVMMVSDERKNSKGFHLLSAGLDTSLFVNNPVMFWKHDRGIPPIGGWDKLRLVDKQWEAEPKVDIEGGEFEERIAGKLERKIIRAASVGILPLEGEIIDGEKWVTKALLLEISLTDIPSNGGALVKLYQRDEKSGKLVGLSFEDLEELNFFNNQNGTQMTKDEKEKFEALEKQMGEILEITKTLAEDNKALKTEVEEVKKQNLSNESEEGGEGEGDGDKDDPLAKLQKELDELKNERLSAAEIVKLMRGSGVDVDPRKDWTFKDWQQKDSEGLELMRKDEPEKFQALLAGLRK